MLKSRNSFNPTERCGAFGQSEYKTKVIQNKTCAFCGPGLKSLMFAIPIGIRLLNRTRPPGWSCARRAARAGLPRPTCGHLPHGGGWDEGVVGRKDRRNFYFGHLWSSFPFVTFLCAGAEGVTKRAKRCQKVPLGQSISRCTANGRAAHRKPAGGGTGKNGTGLPARCYCAVASK